MDVVTRIQFSCRSIVWSYAAIAARIPASGRGGRAGGGREGQRTAFGLATEMLDRANDDAR